jgi:hypothetical protein
MMVSLWTNAAIRNDVRNVLADEEEAAEAASVARNDLEEYVLELKRSLERLQSEVGRTMSWFESAGEGVGREEFEERKLRLQESVQYVKQASIQIRRLLIDQ